MATSTIAPAVSGPAVMLHSLLSSFVDSAALRRVADAPVRGLTDDSRRVRPGDLFIALRGAAQDGRRFVDDALARGAVAVIGEELPTDDAARLISVPNARRTLAMLAARWYGLDGEIGAKLRLIGVTGTNGKSTTVYMIRAILQAAGMRCGMIGTLQYDLCARSITGGLTTPGPLELAEYLRECADAGAAAVAMEVSSHALDQDRIAGLTFAAAAFTNLTQDHLDYHGSMAAYGEAKARLFDALPAGAAAIVNRDDPAHLRMLRECRARCFTYGVGPNRCAESRADATDISAWIGADSLSGTRFRARIGANEAALENSLVGRHNVYNALAAIGVSTSLGVPLEAVRRGLANVRNIPGRLQRVPCMRDVEVFVDYAHTDDALTNVGGVLRPLTRGRLITVFGCGGDRDRTKRPRMAAAVSAFSDEIVVTSDNPRTEDPLRIIDEILAGFPAERRPAVHVDADRQQAILAALRLAQPGDVVLIAGKGHESYQIVGAERRHFDDVEAAIQAAAWLGRTPA